MVYGLNDSMVHGMDESNMRFQDYAIPQQHHQQHHVKKMYAKAIYENIAESPDELAFKRGDILTIIEQDTDGLEGWWLCTLRGRQGICPGNRLKIIPSYDSGGFSPSPVSSPCPSLNNANIFHSSPFMSTDLYENTGTMQKHGKRRSWHIMPNKVVTPQKCGDVYWYDLLPSQTRNSPYQNLSSMSDSDTYDTPKPAVQVNYDSPRSWSRTPPKEARIDDSYDIPKPSTLLSQHNITPSSSNSSLLTSDSLSLSSSNRSSLVNGPDYDIPRRNPPSIRSSTPLSNNTQNSYDIQSNQMQQINTKKELPLELSSALETLAKLQGEATSAITRLLGFVTPFWRTKEKLEPILMDLKLAAVRLRTALHDLAEFGDGALGNAARADDKGLAIKLKPLVKALRDADNLVHDASKNLDCQGWTTDSLSRPEQNPNKILGPPDSLDQLIACAQTLTEDVRQSASFIQGNATLLFKRTTPQSPTNGPTINNNNSNNNEWLEDYDYVSLESKETSAKKNAELREALPQDLQTKFDNVVKSAETAATTNEKPGLNPSDKSLLAYYATQTMTHMEYLTQAIDAFLQTVERNQPPKFFLAYGKFVVLSAHNLVNIGDIVHRNVSKQDIKTRVLQCADSLNEALKTCVANTKKAAQHFPSVTAVQEMVDSVVDISHLAFDLKLAMLQTVQL